MKDLITKVILGVARIINPQVYTNRDLDINVAELRQLSKDSLGYELARFYDENGFEQIHSGDWIQRTHDVWHVLTGLQPSKHDEFMLQAFTRAQVFRPSSTLLVLVGLLTFKVNLKDTFKAYRSGRIAKRLLKWDIQSDWETPLVKVRQKLGIVPLASPL